MELSNEFEVGVPLAEAWEVLTDVERIAPCMPGAELREVEGDEYRGVVKVKVGPISAEYRGAARFLERDDSAHRAVLRAEGREARGQGNANATITASLEPSPKGTKVSVATDLQITGKVAQFGRGVLADVTDKLLGQFVESLEATVLVAGADGAKTKKENDAEGTGESSEESSVKKAGGASGESRATTEPTASNGSKTSKVAADAASANGSTVRRIDSPAAEPVDLVEVAGAPLARRALPVLGGVLAIVAVLALLRRVFRSRVPRT